jgi:hypothetical protein
MNVYSGVNETGYKLFTGVLLKPAINLSPLSTTPAINPCNGFSVITGLAGGLTSDPIMSGRRRTVQNPCAFINI